MAVVEEDEAALQFLAAKTVACGCMGYIPGLCTLKRLD